MALSKEEQKVFEELRRKKGVTVVGYGLKETDGKLTNERAIVVGVKQKLPIEKLNPKEIIPQTIGTTPTDVQERGDIYKLGTPNTERQRPACPGCSIGHKDITAGTFGALVKSEGMPFLLSNNHIFANCNRGVKGDAILQPGNYDGGQVPNDIIATLEKFIKIEMINDVQCPITNGIQKCLSLPAGLIAWILNTLAKLFKKHTRFSMPVETTRAITNTVDCALAKPVYAEDIRDFIFDIGSPVGSLMSELGLEVQKSGRTTGITKGKITLVDAMANVNMGNNEIAVFTDQFEVTGDEPFSAGGDSGSLVLDMEKHAVGLLFAGSDTKTYCNEIQNVISALGLDGF